MKKKITLLILLFLISAAIFPQNNKEIEQLCAWLKSDLVDPQIIALFNKRSDNPSWEELFEDAWAFSTAFESESPGLKEKAHEFIVDAVQEIQKARPQTIEDLCKAVHNYLHQKVFTEYQEEQSRFDQIFVSGRYNCISSSALFLVLARAVNLRVFGVVTENHSYVLAYDNNNDVIIHIETTNKEYGVRIFHDEYCPKYAEWAILNDPVYFLSTILRNRIIRNENRIAESLNLLFFLMAVTENLLIEETPFDPTPANMLLNKILYYASILLHADKPEECFYLLEMTAKYYSENEEWHNAVYAALNNSAVNFVNGFSHPQEQALEILAFIFTNARKYLVNHHQERIQELLYKIIWNTCIDIKELYKDPSAAISFLEKIQELYGQISGFEELFHYFNSKL